MSRSFLKLILIFATMIAGARAAETNAPRSVLTLPGVVKLLGDRNPKIVAEREAIASARADRKTAGAYPNPKLSVGDWESTPQQTIFTGERQLQVSAEQPILIPGQRSSRIAKADADVAAAKARAAANAATITADACAAFMRLLAAQQRTEVLSNALAEVNKLRETILGRATEGAASAYDLARVEVEVGVLSGRFETARADASVESSQLAGLLAITNGLPMAAGALEPWEIPSRFLFDPEAQTAASPQALAAARDAAAAAAGIKSASRSRWPELSLEGGRTWTHHPYGAADFVQVNVEVPIWDTRKGQYEKAKSDARAAEARQASALAEAEAIIRQLSETVERRQASLERYKTDIEPRLAKLKEMSAEAYLMGRHTVFELLDAEQARREVMLEKIETLSSLLEAQIRLLAATGQLENFLKADR